MWEGIKNFSPSEFDSPDLKGSGENMDIRFITLLDRARDIAKLPFNINSGYRTKEHNKKVGGVSDSSHLVGLAADIKVSSSYERIVIYDALRQVGFNRFGIGKTFIHVDNDKRKPSFRMWDYYKPYGFLRMFYNKKDI
jgi:zinc D-Ala-D-Ala carboxypeptidase